MITTATATEMQNNFGRYLQTVQDGGEVLILKNGKEVARLISREKSRMSITDSLSGILRDAAGLDDKKALEEALTEKYGST